MGIDGLCEICEGRLAAVDCNRCGVAVCRMHYDAEMQFCADCAGKVKPDGRRGDTFRY